MQLAPQCCNLGAAQPAAASGQVGKSWGAASVPLPWGSEGSPQRLREWTWTAIPPGAGPCAAGRSLMRRDAGQWSRWGVASMYRIFKLFLCSIPVSEQQWPPLLPLSVLGNG